MATLTLKKKKVEPVKPEIIEYPPIEDQVNAVAEKLAGYKAIKEFLPLEKGIFLSLAWLIECPTISRNSIRKFLYRHCRSKQYLSNVILLQKRHGLSGNVMSDVSDAELDHSVQLLSELYLKE